MNYQTYNCDSGLEDLVKCFWTLEGDMRETQTIVPDGCAEMIFHRGDAYRQYYEDGHFRTQPRCFVIGQITKPLVIQPEGRTDIFAVRFLPQGLAPFGVLPVSDLVNRAVDIKELFGDAGAELESEILKQQDIAATIEKTENFLWQCFLKGASPDDRMNSAVSTILESAGMLSVSELASDHSLQQRQLQRMFKQQVGLSPKQLARLVRLQAAIRALQKENYQTLAEMAVDFNYYDQAHFIKDFKEFTGITPGEFYHPSFRMSHFFSN